MIHIVMAVFEEEHMLPGALRSLEGKNFDTLHVFDGAWRDFGDGRYSSADDTEWIAKEFGAVWHPAHRVWESQEEKRTALFQECGAQEGDYIFVFDADERLEGDFPPENTLTAEAYSVMNKCVGENDLPGIRGEWPFGDYSTEYIPGIRLFQYHASLRCLWPGGYELHGKLIRVYKEDREAYGGYASFLPIVPGLSFTHHGADRDEAKMEAKKAYYSVEHPRRSQRSKDYK